MTPFFEVLFTLNTFAISGMLWLYARSDMQRKGTHILNVTARLTAWLMMLACSFRLIGQIRGLLGAGDVG